MQNATNLNLISNVEAKAFETIQGETVTSYRRQGGEMKIWATMSLADRKARKF